MSEETKAVMDEIGRSVEGLLVRIDTLNYGRTTLLSQLDFLKNYAASISSSLADTDERIIAISAAAEQLRQVWRHYADTLIGE